MSASRNEVVFEVYQKCNPEVVSAPRSPLLYPLFQRHTRTTGRQLSVWGAHCDYWADVPRLCSVVNAVCRPQRAGAPQKRPLSAFGLLHLLLGAELLLLFFAD